MPCLDTAISQSCFQKHSGSSRAPPLFCGNPSDISAFGRRKKWASSLKLYIQIPTERTLNSLERSLQGRLLVKAVATFETTIVAHSIDVPAKDDELFLGSSASSQLFQFSNEDTDEIAEREKLRRMRISKANKGNVPWNKGKKHSPETLRRIRERTKLAMQNPKVKMKLMNLGHAQSDETRVKIGVGVRMGWQRRRKKLMVQERCCLLWQNLIAEASRKGFFGEDELQWDSYEIMDEQLRKEWLESVEMRKTMPRPKGSRRAPKSPEQRRKISEAISAKWADPEYRERVCSALAVYHGNAAGAERKPRKKPSGASTRTRCSVEKKSSDSLTGSNKSDEASAKKKGSRMKVVATPSYKDPLASSKLEMIKKIRFQRATLENRKREAAERARLLIAEAEKAAKALELAAVTSPLARASLIETRKLIAEATQSLEGIDSRPPILSESSSEAPFPSEFEGVPRSTTTNSIPSNRAINGTSHLFLSEINQAESMPNVFALPSLQGNGREATDIAKQMEAVQNGQYTIQNNNIGNSLPNFSEIELEVVPQETDGSDVGDVTSCNLDTGGNDEIESKPEILNVATTKKRWVCGRLVEVVED